MRVEDFPFMMVETDLVATGTISLVDGQQAAAVYF